ncbi:MAG TPA: phytanoyl-CoA dioxygenase family protein [Candidatus Handelsmanbacteria bacterium]|nr:phytanoyl-CoA dioxygenase family protein [Candidatus Handelsmanbacteria bacterium]
MEPLRPLQERTKALSADQVRRFWRQGYLHVRGLLDGDTIAELRQEFDRVLAEARASGQFGNFADKSIADSEDHEVIALNQMCERSLSYHRLLYDNRIVDRLEDLMGSSIQLFHDFFLYKPPGHGGGVFWHQDNQAWQSLPPNNVTCWLALDDADADNGALHYIPASHRTTAGLEVDDDGRLVGIDQLFDAGDAHVVEVQTGDAIFHHCLTLHHSEPNESSRPRRAHSIITMQVGTRCGRRPPYNSRPPTAEKDHFPVCFGHPVMRSGSAS